VVAGSLAVVTSTVGEWPMSPTGAKSVMAGSLHGDVDARAGVDVVDAHRHGAVRGRYQPLLDGERADAGQHVAAVGAGVHRPLADPRPGRTGSPRRSRAGRTARLVKVLAPPTPSSCSRSVVEAFAPQGADEASAIVVSVPLHSKGVFGAPANVVAML
jgi:hypothetical protein